LFSQQKSYWGEKYVGKFLVKKTPLLANFGQKKTSFFLQNLVRIKKTASSVEKVISYQDYENSIICIESKIL